MDVDNVKLVYFKLNTTSLVPPPGGYGIQIVQIGAMYKAYDGVWQDFDEFSMPTIPIERGAYLKHGINRALLRNENAPFIEDTLWNFADFINPPRGCYTILVAHNCFAFDSRVLKKNFDMFLSMLGHPLDKRKLYFYDSMHFANITTFHRNCSLEYCMEYYLNEPRYQCQVALEKANLCRRISEEIAKIENYGSFKHFIVNNQDLLKPYN